MYYIWKCAHLDVVMTEHKERNAFISFRLCAIWTFGNTVEGTFRAVNQPIRGLKYLIIVFHLY